MPIWPTLLHSSFPSIPTDPQHPWEEIQRLPGAKPCVRVCTRAAAFHVLTKNAEKTNIHRQQCEHTHTETHTDADSKRHECVKSSPAIIHITTHTCMNRGCSVGWSAGICRIWPGWSLLQSPGELSAQNAIIYHQNTHTLAAEQGLFVVNI